MYRQRNKQKYFTLHYCGKVKVEAASPGHKKSVKSVGHKKLPQISQIHTDSLSLTQVLHKRKIFFKLFGGKENANERKESLLSICRVQLFFCKENANERKESLLSICRVQLFLCKETTFPRNFQGFRGKYLKRMVRKKIGGSRN